MSALWVVVRATVDRQPVAGAAIAVMAGGAAAAGILASLIADLAAAQQAVDGAAALFMPILLAFGAVALASATFFVVNLVSGLVIGRSREIGLLVAVGCTPPQVVAVYVGQALLPASVGAVAGSLLGLAAGVPLLADAAAVVRPGESIAVSAVAAALVPVGVIVVVGAAAALPARRAGRIGVATVLGRGFAGHPVDLRRMQRLAGLMLWRLPLGPAGRLGLRRIAARPLRAAMTTAAIALGVAAVLLALTVHVALLRGADALFRNEASPVRTVAMPPDAADRVATAIEQDPNIDRYTRVVRSSATVDGLGSVAVFAYERDSSWVGYEPVDGRWFERPGEIVVSTKLFDRLGIAVGDEIVLSGSGPTARVTVVGTIFDVGPEAPDHLLVRGAAESFRGLLELTMATQFEIRPTETSSPAALVSSLRSAGVPAFEADSPTDDATLLAVHATIVSLGGMLLAIAVAGVANTVSLDVAERAHESAVLGALGMSPAERRRMAVAAVLPVALVAGIAGIVLGRWLARTVLSEMGEAAGGTRVPEALLDPLGLGALGLAVAGVLIAVVGAWVPAGVGATRPVADDLRTE